MNFQLERLERDTVSYRNAVDRLFSSASDSRRKWQRCLREILICASQLYLDYLLVREEVPAMEAVSLPGKAAPFRSDIARERFLRQRLQRKLESSACWRRQFTPENAFSAETGLRTLQDYTESLALHLPEIYEETFRVEACAKEFLARRDGCALVELVVGLQHLGRNHISFVLQTLEWATEDLSWEPHRGAPEGSE